MERVSHHGNPSNLAVFLPWAWQVCRGHGAVAKNDLNSLLIAPMQHQCHYLLLLDVSQASCLVGTLAYLMFPAESGQDDSGPNRQVCPLFGNQGLWSVSQ